MTAAITKRNVTLLVEDLRRLVTAVKPDERYPALETVLSRGRHFCASTPGPDHFRFSLFGIPAPGELPIAALTREADGASKPQAHEYWLRTDPVTLWADMARLFVVKNGLADLDAYDRNEIENTVRTVLFDEGIHLHADHPDRWCIALDEPLEFAFTPLKDVLGQDVAEVMQDQPQSLHWRRITNEIQIALHSSPVNIRRRSAGQREINSVWFWGGGFLPDASGNPVFDAVYSDNPVSRGLASINDCRILAQAEVASYGQYQAGSSILIDWSSELEEAGSELDALEVLAQSLMELVRGKEVELKLFCGNRHGWTFNATCVKKFWRRRHQLSDLCTRIYPE